MTPTKTISTLLRGALLLALMMPFAGGCADSHGGGDGGARDSGAVDSGATDGGRVDSGGGSIPRWQRCSDNSECTVVSESCCGSCGQPSPGDMVGVNSGRIRDYRGDSCDRVDCPACFMEPDPNLIATCNAGRCEAIDVRTHAVSSCTGTSQCSLRVNTCCGCSSSGPIAIHGSSESDFMSLVCVGDEVCPECFPAFPEWDVSCQMGHCVALNVGTPPPPAP